MDRIGSSPHARGEMVAPRCSAAEVRIALHTHYGQLEPVQDRGSGRTPPSRRSSGAPPSQHARAQVFVGQRSRGKMLELSRRESVKSI